MIRRADVYRRGATFLVYAQAKTTVGVYIGWEPAIVVGEAEGFGALGRAVVTALDRYRTGVPHPTDWKSVTNRLLANSGARSWKAFVNGATNADVSDEGGRVTITPSRNLGAKEGFQELIANQVVTSLEPAELGRVVAQLLAGISIDVRSSGS